MKNTRTLTAGLGLWLSLVSASAFAQGVTTFDQGGAPKKCGGADIATGPFNYSTPSIIQTTFNGMNGSPISTSFTITAPSVQGQNDATVIDVFPGEGNNQVCSPTADATISVLEISKVGDATGNLLVVPVSLDPFSGVGAVIAGAFSLSPSSNTFSVGATITVNVVVSNPNLSPSDYGDYDIKLAAKADGYGIGVGNGPHFFLSLRAVTANDTTPPVVSVTKPSGDEILGVIGVEVTAFDPDGPVASGLASISASVSSARGTVSGLPISLAFDRSLPQPAGVVVTGTGSFTPTGGAPGSTEGTTDAAAFTSGSRSGIGSYTINTEARDVAGNIGYGSKSFNVKYDVAFTDQSVPGGCNAGKLNACAGRFKFTVKRSNVTSDGAFMFDHTVVVKLVRSDNNVIAAKHVFGTASINDVVQIENLEYQTNFKHSDLPGSPAWASYKLQVYFLDVDGNEMLQAESSSLSL
jgi:hypothetical protein